MKYFVFFLVVVAFLIFFEIAKFIHSESLRAKEKKAKIGRLNAEIIEKFGERKINKDSSLEERNQDIIKYYLGKIGIKADEYADDNWENLAIHCVDVIAVAEGNLDKVIDDAFGIGYWGKNCATPEYFKLKELVREVYYRHHCKMLKSKRIQEEKELQEKFRALKAKYVSLIKKFYTVTEEKVTERDQFGEEKMEELPKLIDAAITKIALREDYSNKEINSWLTYWNEGEYDFDYSPPQEIRMLREFLNESFQTFHKRMRHPDAV